jgi:hypothetical protein
MAPIIKPHGRESPRSWRRRATRGLSAQRSYSGDAHQHRLSAAGLHVGERADHRQRAVELVRHYGEFNGHYFDALPVLARLPAVLARLPAPPALAYAGHIHRGWCARELPPLRRQWESSPGNRRALPRLKQSSIGAVDSLIVGTVCAAVQKHRECFNRSGTKRKRQFSTGFDVVYGYPLMPDL